MKSDQNQVRKCVRCGGAVPLVILFLICFLPLQGKALITIEDDFSRSQGQGWGGSVGGGWLTVWSQGGNGTNISSTAQIVSSPPLTAGKDHLVFSVEKKATGAPARRVTRQYDVNLVGDEHVISFLFRLDTPLSTLTSVNILDAGSSTTSLGSSSWYITGTSGGNWIIYDNNSVVDTSMELVAGEVYEFNIYVRATGYQVEIKNITENTTYLSDFVGYYGTNTVGGYLNFNVTPKNGSAASPTTATISLGSVKIQPIPENRSIVLLAVALLVLGWRRTRKYPA